MASDKTLVIATCISGRELKAKDDITNETGAEAFVPMEISIRSYRHRKSQRSVVAKKPLYPGYIFIESSGVDWKRFQHVGAIKRVLQHEGIPYRISKGDVCDIESESWTVDGVFEAGDRVVVLSGPFKGLRGVVDKKGVVLLKLFGSDRPVNIPTIMLAKI